MDPIKDAFLRAKQDITELKLQMAQISKQLEEIKRTLDNSNIPTHPSHNFSNVEEYTTDIPTHTLTYPHDWPLEALKRQNLDTSTGNKGVPTDRQTNQQTDRQTPTEPKIDYEAPKTSPKTLEIDSIARVSQVLESLDTIKKDLRQQFKRLTTQEMLVFSTIYQLEEEGFTVDYPLIAGKLNLSQSSIRDYTLKIIKKGIPLLKIKENHKKVVLTVPPALKKMATLETIINLRQL